MLRILRDWELRDYIRPYQGLRQNGIPMAKNYMALNWYGAYSLERSIVYFVARQIDNYNKVITSYDIGTDKIKYENGQYVYDNTKLYDGELPDGVYIFEFNDGYETFKSEIFNVKDKEELFLASGAWLASGSFLISDLNVPNPDRIILKQFEVSNDYVQFEFND